MASACTVDVRLWLYTSSSAGCAERQELRSHNGADGHELPDGERSRRRGREQQRAGELGPVAEQLLLGGAIGISAGRGHRLELLLVSA